MNQQKHTEDLHIGRGWLNRAADRLNQAEDSVSAVEFAYAAAIIGNGFIALAHAERAAVSMAEASQMRQAVLTLSDEPETTLAEAVERERRAAAEARPHDDEQPRGEAAYLLEGDDEVATPLPFLGFTTHGHAVGGPVPDDVHLPSAVARCGGPAVCSACALDTDRLRKDAW